jgi:hypothetical protein
MKILAVPGTLRERLKGLELSTFCMASGPVVGCLVVPVLAKLGVGTARCGAPVLPVAG